MVLRTIRRLLPLFFATVLVVGAAWVSVLCGQLQPPMGIHAQLDRRAAVMTPKEFLRLSGVDLNSATQQELEALPRVGEVLARRVLDYRQENGPFGSVEELDQVKGIGPKTVKSLERYLYIK